MLKYIELKTGHSDNGPAWIARVVLSKSGRTIYFNGKALKRVGKGSVSGNHYDLETAESYWVSGVKKSGLDRHEAGSGMVAIEVSAVEEYLQLVGSTMLDTKRLTMIEDFSTPNPATFVAMEHEKLTGEQAEKSSDAAQGLRTSRRSSGR